MSDIKNALDVAAFTMAGNLMVTLFDKGLISREEAIHIINLAQKTLPRKMQKISRMAHILIPTGISTISGPVWGLPLKKIKNFCIMFRCKNC